MKMQSTILCAALLVVPGNAAASNVLDEWPTRVQTVQGDEFGIEGLYRYDLGDFRSGTTDPFTASPLFDDADTWRRSEPVLELRTRVCF